MKNVIGVIMCGGESRRMGSDKGLQPLHDTIWAKIMSGKLSFLEIPVVYSINSNQLASYSHHISTDFLVLDDVNIHGPARGILSVHKKFPGQDMILLACDMLDLDAFTISNIIQVYEEEPFYDYYVYQDVAFAQPFCGIYTSSGVDKLQELIQAEALENLSMQYILNHGKTKRLAIEHKKAFANFNFK
jgi:molybdopterin-guanine dinucleotide biosynthesis protein A